MADFNEVFEKIKGAGFSFSLVDSGKKKGALSVSVGLKPLKETEYVERLFPLLKMAEWDPQEPDDPAFKSDQAAHTSWYVRVFLGAVHESIKPRIDPSTAGRKRNGGVGHVQEEYPTLKFKGQAEEKNITEKDVELLEGLKIRKREGGSGRLILLHTGIGCQEYTGVCPSSSSSIAGELREILDQCPASDEDKQVEEEWIYQERKEHEYRALARENENRGHLKLSVEQMMELSDKAARKYAHSCAERLSRSDIYTARIDRILDQMSARVKGADQAYAAGVDILRNCESTLLQKKGFVSLWYHEEKTKTEDGDTVTYHVADEFERKGDWSDMVAASLENLWGKPALSIEDPKILSNDPNEPCLHFFDLYGKVKEAEGGETEAWDRFLRKMTPDEGDVFKAFLWSILDARNHGRQILYLYDNGYSGKSAVMKAIRSSIGKALCAAVHKDALNNQFAFSKVWDKRLILIGDNGNAHLHQSERMKMITGSDAVNVEYKGRESFMWDMDAKVMVASNKALELNVRERNERTRVLPIRINFTLEQMIDEKIIALDENGKPILDRYGEPIFIGDGNGWPKRLREQFWAFLASCRPAYERLCPSNTDITAPWICLDNLETFSNDRDTLFEEIFDKHFEITNLDSDFVEKGVMQRVFLETVKSDDLYKECRLTFSEWKEFLRRHTKIEATRPRSLGHKWGYVGIRLKSTTSLAETILI